MTDSKEIEKLLSDLHCGSGQWKNIQHIVRFAFQSCFSKVNEQEIRFEALTKEMSNINEKMNDRYSLITAIGKCLVYYIASMQIYRLKKDELRQYLNFHLRTGDYHQKMTKDLASQLHELKQNINLRSSHSSSVFMNGRMQELTDRVAKLERLLPAEFISALSDISIQRVSNCIEELQHKYERLSQHIVDMKDEIRSTSTDPMLQGLRNKVDEIYGLLGDYNSKEQLKVLLDSKVYHRYFSFLYCCHFHLPCACRR